MNAPVTYREAWEKDPSERSTNAAVAAAGGQGPNFRQRTKAVVKKHRVCLTVSVLFTIVGLAIVAVFSYRALSSM